MKKRNQLNKINKKQINIERDEYMANSDHEEFERDPPLEELVITNPELVLKVMHEKKQKILDIIFDEALTIQDIKKNTNEYLKGNCFDNGTEQIRLLYEDELTTFKYSNKNIKAYKML